MWLLKKISFPVSLIYALVVYLRNYLYDINIFRGNSFKTPTICIGNLSVGGTGKTPMIEFLIEGLNDSKLVVLSRGYGRGTKGYLEAGEYCTVEEIGDEPYQIHKKFPNIKVVVCEDRRSAIAKIEAEFSPDLILLDDAYQHRKVKPTLSVLLTTYEKLYVDDWYLPTGTLRDSKKEAKRADVIIVTKCPMDLSLKEQELIKFKLNPLQHQKILFSYLAYDTTFKGKDKKLRLDDIKNRKVTLVTGIASPKPLLGYLKNKEIVFNHLAFKDHHFFTKKEIALFQSKEIILTTEKDYVRLAKKLNNVYYVSIKHSFYNKGAEEIIALINQLR